MIINRLPSRLYHWVDVFCHVAALLVSTALAWYSARLVRQSFLYHDMSPGLDATPLWIPQIGMAAGSAVLVLAFAVELADLLSGKKLRETAGDGEMARTE